MSKKKYFLILLLLFLCYPSFVRARSNIQKPVAGEHPVYIDSNEQNTIINQAWVNLTDRREMQLSDTFEANKHYKYTVQFTGDKKKLSSNVEGGSTLIYRDWEYEETNIREYTFYTGEGYVYPAEEWVHINTDEMRLGGSPVYAKPDSHYQVISDSWYNMTDNKIMTAEDKFEAHKKYKYLIKYKTNYEVQDFFDGTNILAGVHNDNISIVKMQYQKSTGIINTDYLILYTGNLQELKVTEGAVVINYANVPIAKESLAPLEIITNDSIERTTYKWYRIVDGDEIECTNNYVVQEGDTLKLKVNIYKEEGYGIEEGFEVINNNKNYNFLSEETNIDNQNITYQAIYKIKQNVSRVDITDDKTNDYKPKVGDEIQLTAHIYPEDALDKTISWKSNDKNIATVDQTGKVTVLATGNVTIFATASNGVYGIYTLNIYSNLESIELNIKNLRMEVGEYRQLSVSFHPNDVEDKSITWISSNPKVATVDQNGKVTAIAMGQTAIVAKASNGDITSTCNVEVVNPNTPIETTKYKVTFYDDDATTILKDTVEYIAGTPSSEIEKPTNIEKNNLAFVGWYTDPSYTNKYDFSKPINSDLNLYGKWEEINVEITTTPDSIDYGEVYVNFDKKVQRNVIIKNTGNVDVKLNIYNPINTGPFASLDFENNKILKPNEEYTVKLIATPNGNFSDTIGTYNGIYKVTGTYVNDNSLKSEISIPATIKIVKKQLSVKYKTHVQSYGWQDYVADGKMSGTSGEAKRLEGIKIKLENKDYEGSIEYRTHIQSIGWENNYKKEDAFSGTEGRALRLEAIQIRLTGELAIHYDVYYRVHAQSFGWLGWAKNDEESGTATYAKRLEGIEIKVVPKDSEFPEYGEKESFKRKYVEYRTHVQTYGWQDYVADGAMSGTSGEAKRLEGIQIMLRDSKYFGSIIYRTHVQTYGWQDFVADGAMSGTSGEAKRLEAIQILLTGTMANNYDIYYRVHAQSFGWLGWAKNGESAGTEGLAKRLEAIEIVLVNKGESPPVRTNQNNNKAFIRA